MDSSKLKINHDAFKSYYNPIDMQVGFQTGKYGAVNNCQRFQFAMFHQICMHSSVLGCMKLPAMMMREILGILEPWKKMKELGGVSKLSNRMPYIRIPYLLPTFRQCVNVLIIFFWYTDAVLLYGRPLLTRGDSRAITNQ
jgi:hypothetical protein